jgi:hypothetical protein
LVLLLESLETPVDLVEVDAGEIANRRGVAVFEVGAAVEHASRRRPVASIVDSGVSV